MKHNLENNLYKWNVDRMVWQTMRAEESVMLIEGEGYLILDFTSHSVKEIAPINKNGVGMEL